jgi:hypothetical protein
MSIFERGFGKRGKNDRFARLGNASKRAGKRKKQGLLKPLLLCLELYSI